MFVKASYLKEICIIRNAFSLRPKMIPSELLLAIFSFFLQADPISCLQVCCGAFKGGSGKIICLAATRIDLYGLYGPWNLSYSFWGGHRWPLIRRVWMRYNENTSFISLGSCWSSAWIQELSQVFARRSFQFNADWAKNLAFQPTYFVTQPLDYHGKGNWSFNLVFLPRNPDLFMFLFWCSCRSLTFHGRPFQSGWFPPFLNPN